MEIKAASLPDHLMTASALYLTRLRCDPAAAASDAYPFNLPAIRTLDLEFVRPVTFFVGENGTGKSTVTEALAELCGFPASGGGRADIAAKHGPEQEAALTAALRPSFRKRAPDGYFFRAEFQAHFASLLDERKKDPHFVGRLNVPADPYVRYGGRSLHTRSHGEAFLAVMRERIGAGLYLFDEPESALSPQRQLTLLAHMARLADEDQSQFIIATHSPILLTFPNATILSFDGERVQPVKLEDTPHYQITKGILDSPERYWKHLKS